MIKLIIIGCGGHAQSSIDIIERTKKFKIVGIVDDNYKEKENSYKFLGTDKDLPKLRNKYEQAFIGIGHIETAENRIKIFRKLKKLNFKLPKIISSSAIISNRASLSESTIICENVLIGPDVEIGKNSIINNFCQIEHGTTIGDYTHISTRVTLNGDVSIGDRTFVGSSTVVKHGVKIGSNCFIRMGSVITKNVKDNEKI